MITNAAFHRYRLLQLDAFSVTFWPYKKKCCISKTSLSHFTTHMQPQSLGYIVYACKSVRINRLCYYLIFFTVQKLWSWGVGGRVAYYVHLDDLHKIWQDYSFHLQVDWILQACLFFTVLYPLHVSVGSK